MYSLVVRRVRRLGSLLAAALAVTAGFAPARAADQSALEGRIAELEQTVPHAGTRALQLSIYGQVNRALLHWNDGFDSGTAGVDNHTSSSRFGFVGRAGIAPGWSAGYRLEFETAFPASNETFNGAGWDLGLGGSFRIRQSYWDLASKGLGRLSVGYQSPATDDITLINLGSQVNDAALHFNNAFTIGLDLPGAPLATGLSWGQLAHTVDSFRDNFVRYDTPTMGGFMLSAAFSNDVWDGALRYRNGGGGLRFAGGAGYMRDDALKFEDVRGSASLIHDASGLYASIAGGWRRAAHTVPIEGDDARFHYVQLGLSRHWLASGKTTLYVDHGVYRNFNVAEILGIFPGTEQVPWGTLVETEVRRWGLGIEQAVDSANLLLYAQAHFYDPAIRGFPCDTVGVSPCGTDRRDEVTTLPAASWQGVVVGARIQF
jgi:predicted porin